MFLGMRVKLVSILRPSQICLLLLFLTSCNNLALYSSLPEDDFTHDISVESIVQAVSEPSIQDQLNSLYLATDPTERLKEMSKQAESDGPYKIHKGDVLEVSILKAPEMTRTIRVIDDGSITYLIVGEVQSEGKTIKQLREEITKGLSEHYQNPIVSILTIETYEKKDLVTVIGAVEKPGRYSLKNEDARLLDMIAEAGGLKFAENQLSGGEFVANLDKSYISRNGQILENINFSRLLKQGDMQYNIQIKPDDVIYFADSQSTPIYVLGEVMTPKSIPTNAEISVVGAIARARGFSGEAARDKVIVIQPISANSQSVHIVDIGAYFRGTGEGSDMMLSSGDIVIVPEKKLTTLGRYARYMSDILGAFNDAYDAGENLSGIPGLTKGLERNFTTWE